MNIHFISPYAYDLRIGDALNRDVARLPDDSWIVHCDQDTLKPPGFAERVQRVLQGGIAKNVVLTCMTNRANPKMECVLKDMYDEGHLGPHLSLARGLWQKHGTEVVPTEVAPGYCMIFHKQHWISLGGWPASCVSFDTWLSERSTPYLMKGVYIIHLYRWGNGITQAKRKTQHFLQPGYLLQ